MTREDIERFFTYHPPRPDQIPRYERIRKVREAVMTANAAIAVGETDLGGEWVVRGDERETTGADE